MKKLLLFTLLLLFASSIAYSGNLKVGAWINLEKSYDIEEVGDMPEAKIEYENINTKYAVSDIVFNLSIYDDLTNEKIYSTDVELDRLEENDKYIVNYGFGYKEYLNSAGMYRFESTTTQEYDEDESNNTGITTIEISGTPPPKPDVAALSIIYFNKAKFIPFNNEKTVKAVFQNKSISLAATNLEYKMEVKDTTGKVIYSKISVSPKVLAPLQVVVKDFGSLPKSLFDSIKVNQYSSNMFTIEVSVKSDDDPSNDADLSNNSTSISNYFKLEVSFDDLMKGLKKHIEEKGADARTPGYMHSEKLGAGHNVSTENAEINVSLQEESYVGWIDLGYGSKFGHDVSIYTYGINSKNLEFYSTEERPDIYDMNVSLVNTNDVNIIGEEYAQKFDLEGESIFNASEPTTKNRTFALLVSSLENRNPKLQAAYNQDVKVMYENMRNEKLGANLSDANIRAEYGISVDSINSILKSMVGKYDKIYFYYSGNNYNKSKEINSTVVGLSDVGASEYNILIDANNTSVWDTYIEAQSLTFMRDARVTFISSTSSGKKALIETDPSGISITASSYFTKMFSLVYGSSAADLDGDGYTSFAETFKTMKKVDKETNGNDLTVKQLPKMTIFEKPEKDESNKGIRYPNLGITISNISDFSISTKLTAGINLNTEFLESNDSDIFEISGQRTWQLEADTETKFTCDLEFQLNNEYDMLSPSMGQQIGMIYRVSADSEWKAQYPSVYNETENRIFCGNVTHFSEWAAATVKEQVASVDSDYLVGQYQLSPNPFANALTLNFNFENEEHIAIEIIDIQGVVIDRIDTKLYSPGEHLLSLDGSKYSSGVYYCRLISEKGVTTTKLVKVE